MGDDRRIGPFTPVGQLLDGRCPECVSSPEQDLIPLFSIAGADLASRRSFSSTIDTDHQEDIQLALFKRQWFCFAKDG